MLMVEHCNGRYEAMEVGEAVEFRCKAGKAFATQPTTSGSELALQTR